MDAAHDHLPRQRRGVDAALDALRRVVAAPDRRGVVRRVAAEVAVLLGVRGAGLARLRHAGERGGGARAAGAHDALEQLVHGVDRGLLHGDPGILLVVDHDVAEVVHHLREGARLGIDAVVGKRRVARRHLDGVDAGAAETEVADLDQIVVRKRRKAQLLHHERVGLRHAEVHQRAHRAGVRGLLQRVLDGDEALVAAVGVDRPRLAFELHDGIVVDDARRRDDARLQRGRVDRQRLDGAAALRGVGGVAPLQRALALAHASADGDDVAGRVVNDGHAGLEQLPARGGIVEVGAVGVDLLHHALHVGVHGAVDLIAAVVDHRGGGLLAVVHLHQRRDHVAVDLLDEEGIQLLVRLDRVLRPLVELLDVVGVADEDHLLRLGLGILRVVEPAEVVHLAQHRQLTVAVLLPRPVAAQRVELPRVLRDADDGRALGDGQILDVLAEIGLRRGLDAVGRVAEVDEVEIRLEDVLLAVLLMHAQRAEDLKDLAADRDLVLPRHVLDHLLRDGGRAAGVVAHERVVHAARRALPVHALMLVEALVLDGDERLHDVVRDLLVVDERAVLDAVELRQLHPLSGVLVLVIDRGALLERVGGQVDVHLRLQLRVHVLHERAEKHRRREGADDQQRKDDLGDPQQDPADARALFLPSALRYGATLRLSARFRARRGVAFLHGGALLSFVSRAGVHGAVFS